MKKYLGVNLIVLMMLFTVLPINASSNQIVIDGITLASDVSPETVNNRTMVPLRIIGENLGVQVDWLNNQVTLTKDDTSVILKPNSNVAIKNSESVKLDANAYLKNNRIMVPLRFIAETFGCAVNYKNSIVTVNSDELVINGIKIKALQEEIHMTMGGEIRQIYGNAYIKAIYNTIINTKGVKVDAPDKYSWMRDIDTKGAYFKKAQIDFIDTKDNSIQRYDIYYLVYETTGYTDVLLHDVTTNNWYLFDDIEMKSIRQTIDSAEKNGFIIVISNTIV